MKNILLLLMLASAGISIARENNHIWSPTQYELNSKEQRGTGERVLDAVYFAENEDVLDIGCGDGYLTSLLAQKVSKGTVTAIDKSHDMIKHAASKYNLENLIFHHMDANFLDYHQQFDKVISLTALHWIPDHREVLSRVHKSLRKSGVFVTDMPSGLFPTFKQALNETVNDSRWNQYFTNFHEIVGYFSAAEYKKLLLEAELKPLYLEQYLDETRFSNREALATWLRQWLRHLQPLSELDKSLFLDNLVTRYLSKSPAMKDGTIIWNNPRIRVIALKDK